jgi:PAS domain S-box-containing protein
MLRTMARLRHNSVLHYGIALLFTAGALALRWLLDPWLTGHLGLVTLTAAVAAAVWAGGVGPAVAACLAGYLSYIALFQPGATSGFREAGGFAGLLAYVASCAIIIGLGEAARRAQRWIDEGRELLRITFSSAGDGLISTDRQGRVRYMNPVAENLTGWTAAEAAGRPLSDVFQIVNEETRQPVANPALRALNEGVIFGLANHTVLIARHGAEIPIDDSGSPIRRPDGSLEGAVLIFRDISDRRRLEKEIAERLASSRLLASIVESSNDVIVSKSLDGIIQTWNAAAERLFGWTAAEAVGRSITLIIPPDRLKEEEEILARLRAGQRVNHFETIRRTRDGRSVAVSLTVSPILDESGTVVGASKIARDISDKKEAEGQREALLRDREKTAEALRRSIEQLQIVTESMSAPVTHCSRDLRYLWVSRPYAEWIGRPAHEIVGQPIESVIGAEAMHHLRPKFEKVLSGERVIYEEEIPFRGIGARWVKGIYTPTFGADGVTDGWVAVVIDIHDFKSSEAALRNADRRKDEFLATLAHELRNPLTPILNSVELMKRNLSSAPLATMERQVRTMARLIDDLLDVSRLTLDRLELRLEPITLDTVVSHALEAVRPIAESYRHTVDATLPDKPVRLVADEVRLTQVLGNLLTNACKYTPPGGHIELSARVEQGHVVIAVSDSGIGIPREMLPRVFDLFTQVDQSLERSVGGLGIGLSLVSRLVEMHGGTVTAESEGPGRGSRFTVRLPLGAEAPGQVVSSTSERAASPERRRILVVDDNVDSAVSLGQLLELSGHEVRVAHDGEQALSALSFRPEVVILDIGLPGMNGYDLCRAIRAATDGHPPQMIALTGWGQDEDRLRSADAGFDAHLVKPVDLDALSRLLQD